MRRRRNPSRKTRDAVVASIAQHLRDAGIARRPTSSSRMIAAVALT